MYAIVDDKLIHGIGATPKIAEQDAGGAVAGTICVPCTERLAALVEAKGGRVKFDIVAGTADIRWTGKDLRAWREAKGWSRAALAGMLGLSPGTVMNYEAGKRRDTGKKVPVPLYIRLACERLERK